MTLECNTQHTEFSSFHLGRGEWYHSIPIILMGMVLRFFLFRSVFCSLPPISPPWLEQGSTEKELWTLANGKVFEDLLWLLSRDIGMVCCGIGIVGKSDDGFQVTFRPVGGGWFINV